PHPELGRFVFGCQARVAFELGSDGYFRGGARRAENSKNALSSERESLCRGDGARPQDLHPQQFAVVPKGAELIRSKRRVATGTALRALARAHAVWSIEQNGGRSSSPGNLEPSTRRQFALCHVEYFFSGH